MKPSIRNILLIANVLLLCLAVFRARAVTLTPLASFDSSRSFLRGGFVQGTDGNFYGVSYHGSDGNGALFRVTIDGTLTTLVTFNGLNGQSPNGNLIQDSNGNFYGTTVGGGANNLGTIFRMTPDGTLTTLVSFDGANGRKPWDGLILASNGHFYGTTGGQPALFDTNDDAGTIFRMTLDGMLTTLVSFRINNGNGTKPNAGLVQGSDGNFYGTTSSGGRVGNSGTVFKMTPDGVLTTFVSFDWANGSYPLARLIQATDGNFYGTTAMGGGGAGGTAFRMTPDGTFTTIAMFNGLNGYFPTSPLIQGNDGNFYGTTMYGKSPDMAHSDRFGDDGTIFQISTNGTLTTLIQFDGINGRHPECGLIRGVDGELYGATPYGGAEGYGAFFRLSELNVLTNAFGSFNGLFSDVTNGISHSSAGFFTLKVKASQSFSGKLLVDGDALGFSGAFNSATHTVRKSIVRKGKPALVVQLRLAANETISGWVSPTNGEWVAKLVGDRAVFNVTNSPPTNFLGAYTMVIPGSTNGEISPGGAGYGTIRLSTNGFITVAGSLADGARLSQKISVSKDGMWPFYVPSYRIERTYKGSIIGWITVSNGLSSSLSWIKMPLTGAAFYPLGFTNYVDILSSRYLPPPPGAPALSNNTDGGVITKKGNLITPFTNQFSLLTSNTFQFAMPNANTQTLTLNPKSGLLVGSFSHPNNANTKTVVKGVLLQDKNLGYGFFLGRDQSGAVLLQEKEMFAKGKLHK